MSLQDLEINEKEIIRKVTVRILPLLLLAYFMSFLDRVNVGVLATSMEAELHLTAETFGFAVGMFYIGYVLFQVPSNIAMHRFGGRVWITRIMVTWGIASAAMAFVQNPVQLYIARFLLGVAEAGLMPSVLLFVTYWYPRRLRATPYAIIQMGEPVALALGSAVTAGLLAALSNVGLLSGWRWVFLVEGALTVLVGALIWCALPSKPHSAGWLRTEERAYLSAQVEQDLVDPREDSASGSEGRKVVRALLNGKAWYLAISFLCVIVGFWTITYYMPQILTERFDVSPVQGGLLTALPWTVSFFAILGTAYLSRNAKKLNWYFVGCLLVAALGFYLAASTVDGVLSILGLCIACAGIESVFPLFYRFTTDIFYGIAAAVALALVNAFGNVGGFVGPYLYGLLTVMTGSGQVGLYLMGGLLAVGALMTAFIERFRPQDQAGDAVNDTERTVGAGAPALSYQEPM